MRASRLNTRVFAMHAALAVLVANANAAPPTSWRSVATNAAAPTSWRSDAKAAFDRGYEEWFKEQLCAMFNMCCPETPADEPPVAEGPDAALHEGVCTEGAGSPCSGKATKFALAQVAQAKSVLLRQSALYTTDVSSELPGKLWPVGNSTLDNVLRWRDSLKEDETPSPLPIWREFPQALALMNKALKEDELSALEVHAPGERDGFVKGSDKFPVSEYSPPIDVRTYLVSAPFASSQYDPHQIAHDELKGSQPPQLVPRDGDGGKGHARQLQNPGIYPWPSNVYGPNDNRVEIRFPNNFVWGWSTLVSTGNRQSVWCSGTMISPTVVLTAAHCVATGATMGSPGGINWLAQPQICVRDVQRVTPTVANPTVMDCTTNGGILANWSKMTTFVKWARDGDTDWDIAWITLKQRVGYTSGWKGIRTAFYSPGTIVNNAGYGGDCAPGADCSDNMKTHWCSIEKSCTTSKRYYFKCDAIGGMSGSGTYIYYKHKEVPDNRFVIGVLAYARGCGGFNRAVRIRPKILAAMCSSTTDMLCF